MTLYEQAIEEPRSWFLIAMTFIANLFLLSFVLDAGLSTADDLLQVLKDNDSLSVARILVAAFTALLSLVMLPILLFVPHLPRLALLPPALFGTWMTLGAPPFFPEFESAAAFLPFDIAQLVFALFALFIVRRRMDGNIWLSTSLLPRKRFLVLRTIAALFSVAIVGTALTVTLMITSLVIAVETETGGYVDVTTESIDLQEKVLTKGNKTVRLVGMMHIGEPDVYVSLFKGFPPDALVLAEGVTDRNSRLGANFSYSRGAQAIGLAQQPALREVFSDAEDEGEGEADGAEPKPKTHPDVIRSDIDMAEFSEVTIQVLKVVAKFYASSSPNEAYEHLNTLATGFTEEEGRILLDDLVTKRNSRVVAEFDKQIGTYDTIIIPWGAMHMPGIEAALLERGFKVSSERRFPIVRYETLFARAQDKAA